VSKPFFEALLETFAREAEAAVGRIILLVLVLAGIRLVYLPPYSPELQPAETLWALLDEPIVSRHIATIEQLEEEIANQCVALAEQPERLQTRIGFHWWPKRITPN
jgi:transposase